MHSNWPHHYKIMGSSPDPADGSGKETWARNTFITGYKIGANLKKRKYLNADFENNFVKSVILLNRPTKLNTLAELVMRLVGRYFQHFLGQLVVHEPEQ